MFTQWLTILQNFGALLRDLFLLPGEVLLSRLAAHAPWLATQLGITEGATPFYLEVAATLLPWLLLALVVHMLRRLGRDVARYLDALARTAVHTMWLALRNFETRLKLAPRRLVPRRMRRRQATATAPIVEFDVLDLAILRSALARGPGSTLSAAELAGIIRQRPAQIQRSLEKLSTNKMLDHASGRTDGFDNYRLTDSGAAFITMWQRQQAQQAATG